MSFVRILSRNIVRSTRAFPATSQAPKLTASLTSSTRPLVHTRSAVVQQRWATGGSTIKEVPVVTYEQLKPMTEQPSLDRVLIDVREVHEVEQGSIPSSVNVPLSVFPQAFEQTPDAFRKTYGFDRPEKHQEIIVYCRSGKRSATAADIIWHKGYSKVKNYTGSWLDWVKNEQGEPKV